jgi:glycosyltransferase involved in cell wall biosynthesis
MELYFGCAVPSGNENVFVIIAAFNEMRTISHVASQVRQLGYTTVVVDDGSIDGTPSEAFESGALVVEHPFNLGQGAALQTGIDFSLRAGAEVIVTFDADGQHSASDIARLVHALSARKADFALGSRFLGNSSDVPVFRRILLKAVVAFTRLTTGLRLTDAHNGLRAMTRRGAKTIRLRQNRMAHASEILSQIAVSGLAYVEEPVTIRYTTYSLAKGQKAKDSVVILMDLVSAALYRRACRYVSGHKSTRTVAQLAEPRQLSEGRCGPMRNANVPSR